VFGERPQLAGRIGPMKLLRWAVAGATVYAVYRYSIGRKAKGEDVFVSQERELAKLTNDADADEQSSSETTQRR
jgi:hypothetical protein